MLMHRVHSSNSMFIVTYSKCFEPVFWWSSFSHHFQQGEQRRNREITRFSLSQEDATRGTWYLVLWGSCSCWNSQSMMLFSFFFPQIGAEVTNRNMQHFLLWIYDSTNHIHLRNNWVPLSFLWLSAVISCCQVPQGSGNDLWLGARQRAVEMLHGHWAQATYRCTPRVMCEKNTYKAISTWNWERLSQAEEEDWNIAIQQQTLLPDVAMYSHQSKLWPKCSCHGTVCGTAWHTLIDLIDIFYVLVLSALVKFPLNQLDAPASWFWKAIWLPGAKALKKRTNSRSKFRCAPAAALQVGTRDFSRCWGFFFCHKKRCEDASTLPPTTSSSILEMGFVWLR